MKNPKITRITSLFLASALGLQLSASGLWGDTKTADAPIPIAGLFTGPPPSIGVDVPESAFRTQLLYKINPEFMDTAWLNWEWYWDHNIQMPSEDKIAEFKKEVEEEAGWGVPGPNDPPGMFDMTRTKKVWVDYYGGNHMGTNSGSGRATTAGNTQMKANGATVMVTSDAVELMGSMVSHKDGDSTLEDVSTEFLGEFANREYPHGGYRPLALFQRDGNSKKIAGVIHNPRGMAWREFPQRIAQYEPAPGQKEMVGGKKIWKWTIGAKSQYKPEEVKRIQEVLGYLPNALPKPDGHVPGTPGEEIHAGSLELARRIAEQRALEWGLGVQQGSNSASNRGLKGEVLDTATFTSLPQRFSHIVLPPDAPFGTTEKLKKNQVNRVFQDIRDALPADMKQYVPDMAELERAFDTAYDQGVREQMLLQAGTPQKLVRDLAIDPQGKNFADYLQHMAMLGINNEPMHYTGMVNFTAKGMEYDLNKILPAMTAVNDPTRANLSAAIEAQVPDQNVRDGLIENYLAYNTKLVSEAATMGMKPEALKTYAREQSALRSTPISDLNYAKMKIKNLREVQKAYRNGNDYSNYQGFIDGMLERSRRTYKDARPTDMVIEEKSDKIRGTRVRRLFDSVENRYVGDVVIRVQNGQGFFYGQQIPLAELEKAKVVSGNKAVRGQLSADGKTFEFRAPIADSSTAFSFKIVSGDKSKTWNTYDDKPLFTYTSRDAVETPIDPKKVAYDHDPEKVVEHQAGDTNLTPIVNGKQYIALPVEKGLSASENIAVEPALNEALKTAQTYLALRNVQFDGTTPPVGSQPALDKKSVKGHYAVEVPSADGSRSLDATVRNLSTRYATQDFRGIQTEKPWLVHDQYDLSNPAEAFQQLKESLVGRFGVTPEVAEACIRNLSAPSLPNRAMRRSAWPNMRMDQWIPFWNWEDAPFVNGTKKPLLNSLTKAFIENVAGMKDPTPPVISQAFKTWASASNLDRDMDNYLRPPRPEAGPHTYEAAVTGPVDVNKISMGHEFTASFPIKSQTKFTNERFSTGSREWLYTRYDLSPEEREHVIKNTAEDLGAALNDGKPVTAVRKQAGHGHDLSVAYTVKDPEGKDWRVEWDGVGRSYDPDGEIVDDSVGRGHIELVTPKYVPNSAVSDKVFQTFAANNLYPNSASGGGHLSVDLSAFDGHPEAMARWLLFLHENRGVMALMFQHVNRQNTALHFDLTPELQAGLQRIAEGHGSEADLKKLLYDSKYFNDRVGRKTRYTAWNITDYFKDVIPAEFLTTDFNIKNDPWHPQFIAKKKGSRAEFRMADAPSDSVETGLFTKLIRASLNYAFNDKTPVNTTAQDVDYHTYLINPDYAYEDLAHLCKEAHLDPTEYSPMIEKGLATTDVAVHASNYRSVDEVLSPFPKAEDLPGLKNIWGKAVDPRPERAAIDSSAHEWKGNTLLSEKLRQGRTWWARKQAEFQRNRIAADGKINHAVGDSSQAAQTRDFAGHASQAEQDKKVDRLARDVSQVVHYGSVTHFVGTAAPAEQCFRDSMEDFIGHDE